MPNSHSKSEEKSIRSDSDIKKDIINNPDKETKKRLVDHIRFLTHTLKQQMLTLGKYVQRILVGQNVIYYAIGRFDRLKDSDYVHRLEAAGLEVV